MERHLQPDVRIVIRRVLFGVLIIPALVASSPWFVKIVGCAMVAFLTGTYRESRIVGSRFETRMVFLFVRRDYKKFKLDHVVTIETGLEDRAGWGTFFLFGPLYWAASRACDFLLPWVGGEFKLWLRSARGRRLLAWQGNSEDYFQSNLEILQTATGADVERV